MLRSDGFILFFCGRSRLLSESSDLTAFLHLSGSVLCYVLQSAATTGEPAGRQTKGLNWKWIYIQMKAAGPAVMAQGHRLVIVQLITTRLFCAVVMATESPGSKSRTSKLNDLGAISFS